MIDVAIYLSTNIAFHQGLELSFVYGALTCSSASLAALGLVLRTRDSISRLRRSWLRLEK